MSRAGGLGAACLANAVLLGGAYLSLPPFFAEIASTEGWSIQQLQRAWAFVPLGSGAVALMAGIALRRLHDRVVIALSGGTATLGVVLRSIVERPEAFAWSLLLFGLGAGALLVALTTRVARLYETEGAGLAQAAFFGAYTIGSALGLATAELLAEQLGGWRAVAGFWATASAIALVPTLFMTLPPGTNDEGDTPNRRGTKWRKRISGYALVYAAYVGGYLGIAGLLPYQLRQWGWEPKLADAALASSTLGFLVGAFFLAAVTDRWGHRRQVFTGCMIAAAALTGIFPAAARASSMVWAGGTIAAVGFFCGALSLFFPIVLQDPETGGPEGSRSVGLTTAASYLGGFLVPFAFAPFTAERPALVIGGYAVIFAISGIAMAFVRPDGVGPPTTPS
ncbi:MAG: MFS transporter [Polyangiales bacterium]